jgi:hypothetical protein
VKKLLLIFLLMALPFQYSWAAAAMYCQHEKAHATHFGHHSHQHQAQPDEPDGQSKSTKFHNDCGYCHLSCQAPLLMTAPDITVTVGLAHPEVIPLSFSSHIPDGPKRPDRRLVA